MKFHSLPIGTRFVLKGETYIKDKPLIATLERNGKSQFIHRSAMVEPLELGETSPAEATSSSVDLNTALSLIEGLHQHCQNSLIGLEHTLGEAQVRSLKQELETLKNNSIKQLERASDKP